MRTLLTKTTFLLIVASGMALGQPFPTSSTGGGETPGGGDGTGQFNHSNSLGGSAGVRMNTTGLLSLQPAVNGASVIPASAVVGQFLNNDSDAQNALGIGPDGFGRIIVSWFDGSDRRITFIQCGDSTCTQGSQNSQTISTADGLAVLRVGTDGHVRIFYTEYSATLVYHFVNCTAGGSNDCASFTDQTVFTSTNSRGFGIAMALDSSNRGQLIWDDYDDPGSSGSLQIRQCTNASCSTKNSGSIVPVVSGGGFEMAQIQLASDGFPRVAYNSYLDGFIHFVVCNDALCTAPTDTPVVDFGGNGYYIDMALSGLDLGRIVASNGDSGTTSYIDCTNASCSASSTVDVGHALGNPVAIYLVGDVPHILNENLFVLCADATCADLSSTLLPVYGYPAALARGLDGLPRVLGGSYPEFTYFQFLNDTGSGTPIGSPSNPIGQMAATEFIQVNEDGSLYAFRTPELYYGRIQIGSQAKAGSDSQCCAIAIGGGPVTSENYGIALGSYHAEAGNRGVAIGTNAIAGNHSVAIGDSASATGLGTVLLTLNSGPADLTATDSGAILGMTGFSYPAYARAGVSDGFVIGYLGTTSLAHVLSVLPACQIGPDKPAWQGYASDLLTPVVGSAAVGGGSVWGKVQCSITTGQYIVEVL